MSGINIVLQNRDWALLHALAIMRIIDREQSKVVTRFGSTSRANARLLALTRAGLLRRFFIGTADWGPQSSIHAVFTWSGARWPASKRNSEKTG